MRLRNVPGAEEAIENSRFCITQPERFKGKWHECFGNDNPIHLEIGMGKGRFLMNLARQNADINYLGIEMYSSVMIRALSRAEELERLGENRGNFFFVRMDARHLSEAFAPGEVKKIYLNFSDPWPKARHAKRRLTSVRFLKRYEAVMPKGGEVEFKTDNADLFDFSLAQAKAAGWEICGFTTELHKDKVMNEGNIMTEYEERFAAQGVPICKMIIKNNAENRGIET